MSSKKTETRNKILQATLDIMENSSGKGTRMSDIAKKAGISRQAMYLHFDSRIELMIATVGYVDEIKGLNERLQKFNQATTGIDLLNALVEVWANYIPEIYGISKAMLRTLDNDEATAAAWRTCMGGLRSFCQQIVEALKRDNTLNKNWSVDEAVEVLWTIISIHNWEQLVVDCGWSNVKYIEKTKFVLNKVLVLKK